MDIVPVAVAVALVAVSVVAALVGRHRARSGRRSAAGIRPVLVMVGGPPAAVPSRMPARPTATSGRLFAAARHSDPPPPSEPSRDPAPEPPSEPVRRPGAERTREPEREPTLEPEAAAPRPPLDLRAYSALDIERSVSSGTGALIDALVATGELGTSGPVTDAEVRTLVFVSVASTELLQVLLDARPELPA